MNNQTASVRPVGRCTAFDFDELAGCMESIVHYKLLLVNKSSGPEAASLTEECRTLLKRLQELDPSRWRRYYELGESVPLISTSTDLFQESKV